MAFCGLDNVDCPLCDNRGYTTTIVDGWFPQVHQCSCMARRISLRNAKNSGMVELLKKYRFENYEHGDQEQDHIYEKAQMFANSDGGWFYISGKSGSGKTHICTAVCNRLVDRGKQVKYMLWRDDSTRLKGLVNDNAEYQVQINPFKLAPVLYIDDLFKGSVTEADIKLAFEIINYRYNDDKLRTIISSELVPEKVLDLDEATGGRIIEKSKGYVLKAPDENWRLRA